MFPLKIHKAFKAHLYSVLICGILYFILDSVVGEEKKTCREYLVSFNEAIFFSLITQSTIGYGVGMSYHPRHQKWGIKTVNTFQALSALYLYTNQSLR